MKPPNRRVKLQHPCEVIFDASPGNVASIEKVTSGPPRRTQTLSGVKIARCHFFDRVSKSQGLFAAKNVGAFVLGNALKIRTSVAWVGWRIVRVVEFIRKLL
jgi:hypothetical protein